MGSIWTEENEDRNIVKVEITACEAMNKLGIVPDDALHDIQTKADFDLDRVHEIEKTTNHDIISLLTSVAEHVGDASKYIHKGLTSNDVKDTAMGLMMKHSAEILIREEKELHEILKNQAQKYRYTYCVGRTHGIHAEPMTFGLKFLLWMSETERNIERLELAKKYISVGKLSGAIGTYSNIDPFVEQYVCEKLGLTPVPVANQVVQRDRHAFYLSTIAVCGASLEKMALEIRHLQRTERALLRCRISATRSPAKKSAAWPASCAAMPKLPWKMWRSGMNGISPILPWNGSSCRIPRSCWITCSAR